MVSVKSLNSEYVDERTLPMCISAPLSESSPPSTTSCSLCLFLFADYAFPVFTLSWRQKTQGAYRAVFSKLHDLVPEFQF